MPTSFLHAISSILENTVFDILAFSILISDSAFHHYLLAIFKFPQSTFISNYVIVIKKKQNYLILWKAQNRDRFKFCISRKPCFGKQILRSVQPAACLFYFYFFVLFSILCPNSVNEDFYG